jgi:energy-coupling factor transporter ATP-binding protein EcfA2
MSKLLPNLPIEDLTLENDYLGIIDKGKLIKTFLESNQSEFAEIKMFTIYGEWGSGKSTLLKYLQKEVKSSFNTFFFEAWEFESDSNLSLSLLEYLIKESDETTEKACKELLKIGEKLFRGFTKSVSITFPGVSIDGSKIYEPFENDEKSFLQSKEEFKTEFIRWEDNITRSERPDYNVIFIDDLDRCEPENVLNLLSAIKLFFTYGKKTIFFCGIDKKAVSEAVKTKYGEVVKANEYLEKVFDISFSMPTHSDIKKMTKYYIGTQKVEYNGAEKELSELINDFFVKLHFTNPRRAKKVLNKYLLIYNIVENSKDKNAKLPNIVIGRGGTLFEIYLTLFLLIMYEFDYEEYRDLFNMDYKRSNYNDVINKSISNVGKNEEFKRGLAGLFDPNLIKISFKNLYGKIYVPHENFYYRIISLFMPNNVENIYNYSLRNKLDFLNSFDYKDQKVQYYFCVFLYEIEILFKESSSKSFQSFSDYKKMIVDLM